MRAELGAIVAALPLRPDSRVLEIGCGPGAAARAIAERLTTGRVLATDRSATACAQAARTGADLIAAGRLEVRQVAGEDLELVDGEAPYDLVLAVRVGALDGRHPRTGVRMLERIAAVTTRQARLVVDGAERPIPR